MKAHGFVHKYGDNVDTDVIIPARHLNTANHKELASHCMEDIDAEFVNKVKDGDIMVAGFNFGCGSSRNTPPSLSRNRESPVSSPKPLPGFFTAIPSISVLPFWNAKKPATILTTATKSPLTLTAASSPTLPRIKRIKGNLSRIYQRNYP